MYEIVKDSILKPKNLSKYIKVKASKIFLYFLFLTVLFAVPDLVFFLTAQQMGPSTIAEMQAAFQNKEVPYTITDNRLEKTTDVGVTEVQVTGYDLSFVFDPDNETYNPKSMILILFKEDRIQLSFKYFPTSTTDIITYQEINKNIDFNQAKTSANYEFWETFLQMTYIIMAKHRALLLSVGIPFLLIVLALSLLFIILLTSGIITLLNRGYGAKFKHVFRIAVFAYTPYVVGVLLSLLFSLAFLSTLSSIIAVIYAVIGTSQYLREQMIHPHYEE